MPGYGYGSMQAGTGANQGYGSITPQYAAPSQPAATPRPAAISGSAGYGSAIQNLQSALGQIGNLGQGTKSQLQSQLQQNQGQIQNNLINAGLGNTTVAQTMQQAPLDTYNQGMLNLAQQQAQDYMSLYGQAANVNMQDQQMLNQQQQFNTAYKPGTQGVGGIGGLDPTSGGILGPSASYYPGGGVNMPQYATQGVGPGMQMAGTQSAYSPTQSAYNPQASLLATMIPGAMGGASQSGYGY